MKEINPKTETELFENTLDAYICVCGSKEVFIDHEEGMGLFFVSCHNEKCELEAHGETDSKAIESWNNTQILLFAEKEKNDKKKES